MKIINAKVKWWLAYGNSPTLEVIVDKVPNRKDLRYTEKGNCYLAEKDGYVHYLYHNPNDETGFGGSIFNITLNTGEKVSLKGPWSSRAGVMNNLFPTCVDVRLEDCNGYQPGAITLDLALEAAKIAGVTLVKTYLYNGEDIVWEIEGKNELLAKIDRMELAGVKMPNSYDRPTAYEEFVLNYKE